MNIKKIGLTALAASLVSVSAANAGSLSMSGAASVGIGGYSSDCLLYTSDAADEG